MKILDVPQSGSVAGVTSSRNRFGQYRRTRAIPVNPKTPAQSNARMVMTQLARSWQTLSDESKNGWNTFAHNHPRTDALGQTQVITGFMQYVSSNASLTAAGRPIIVEPGLTSQASQSAAISAVASAAGFTLSVSFQVPTSGYSLLIFASPQRSPGTAYESQYVRLAVAISTSTTPLAVGVPYVTRFGQLVAGRRIFFQARVIDPNGLDVTDYYRTTIIVGP